MLVHSIRRVLSVLAICLLAVSAPLMAAVSYTTGEWKNISPSAVNINDKFGCNDIRIDPSNPNILYTCWDEQGMHKSTDGGATWARIGQLDSPLHLRVDPNNGQHLYAVQGVRGEAMGFWISNNGGANWTRPSGFTDLANNIGVNRNDGGKWDYDLYDLAVDPTDFNHVVISWHTGWTGYEWSGSDHNVWVGDNWGAGIFETTDGGNRWTRINPHPGMRGVGNSVQILYNPAKSLGMDRKTWLLGTQQSGLWRTTNGGGAWTQVSTIDMTHGGMQILTTADGTLYTGCSQGVMVSTDNGATWTVRNGGNGLNMSNGYFTVLSDGARFYAQPGVWRGVVPAGVPWYTSTDGNSWSAFNTQTFNGGAFNGVYDAANGILYSANWGSGAWGLKVSGGSTPPVTTAPSISAQPANASVTAGQTATFSVTASGSGTLSYQWQRNGTAISGATGASYTTPATSTGDHGATYRVVVTGSGGSTTSAQATLTVTTAHGPTPPPTGGTAGAIDTASEGTIWYLRNETLAKGWTEISTPILVKAKRQGTLDSGDTRAVCLTMAPNGDLLLASNLGVFRSQDQGRSWTPIDGATKDTRASNGTGYPETAGSIIVDPENSQRFAYLWFRGHSYFTDGSSWFRPKGPEGQAYPGYDCASIDWTTATPQVFAGPRHGGGPLDITRDGGNSYDSQPKLLNATGDAGPGSGDSFVCVVDANIMLYNQGSNELASNGAGAQGLFRSTDAGRTWTRIRDGLTSTSKNPIALRNGTIYVFGNNALWISRDKGQTWTSRSTPKQSFQGPFAFGDWTNGRIGGLLGKSHEGVIYSKDEGQTWQVLIGSADFPTTFDQSTHGELYSANATGWIYNVDRCDYQYGGGLWSFDAERNIIYATSHLGGPVIRKQLSGTPPGPAAAGSSGTPPTSMAPTIQTHPSSQSVNAGQTATFTVSASGTPSPSYQWQRNGTNISGATAASYTTAATTTGDTGSAFRVVVTNSAGSATSNAATLTVTAVVAVPTITTAPQAATVLVGQTATFTVTAAGSAPLTYQWQRNGTNISGATAASYTTPATVIGDNGAAFRVIASNSAGAVTSSAAILTVTDTVTAPTISAQPVNAAVTVGQVATFNVTAIGTATLSYQWQRNGTNIAGANGPSYTTPTTVLADDGALFRVVVNNTAGSVTSSAATLRVTAGTPPPDTTPPATPTVPTVAGSGTTTPTLSGTTESGATLTIRAGGVVIGTALANGAGQWSFNISGLTAGPHSITVTATDSAGNASATSPSLTVTVGAAAPPTGGASSTPPTSSNGGSSGGSSGGVGCGMGGGLAGIGLLLISAGRRRRPV